MNVVLAVLFAAPRPSVTVTVTMCVPALVNDGSPLIVPVVALIVSPGGSPVAL